MNVLYVFGGERAQGAEIVIERLMAVNADKVNTHLILSPGKFADELIAEDKNYRITTMTDLKKLNRSSTSKLRYFSMATGGYLKLPVKIIKYVRKHKIDVVHANTIVPSSYLTLSILFARFFMPSVKWIWSDHDVRNFSNVERHVSRICVQSYDRTLVVSNALKLKYPGFESKVTVLYNGLDPEIFKSDEILRNRFREKHQIAPETIIIGIAAVIHVDKGQSDLIKAFQSISKDYPNVKLVIAGDFAVHTPEYSKQVQAQIEGDNRIIYMGFVNPINEFYNGCDIIISNSNKTRSESLGTSIYEAMACKKILIASDTGGTPEIITDKVDGFLFPPESIEGLNDQLIYVLSHFDEMEHIRLMARKKVLDKFNIKVMVEKYNLLLDSIMV